MFAKYSIADDSYLCIPSLLYNTEYCKTDLELFEKLVLVFGHVLRCGAGGRCKLLLGERGR